MRHKALQYMLDRAREASTWRGVVLFATATLGLSLSPDQATQVIATGVALAGLIAAFFPDQPA